MMAMKLIELQMWDPGLNNHQATTQQMETYGSQKPVYF